MGYWWSKLVSFQTKEATLKSTDNSQKLLTDTIIHRLAIDPFAVIGSLYDAKKDYVFETLVLNISSMLVTSAEKANYPAVDVGILEGKRLPEMIRIDEELCLSIYLNIVASERIPSLINYPFAINKYTRFLSYYYPTKKIHLINEENVVESKVVLKSILATTTTHVITAIQFGIHVIVILQLSPKYESDLDRLLEKIKNQLTVDTFQIEPDEEDLLNQFTDVNVFSNMSDIAKLKKLTDVCQKLTGIISDDTQPRALEYTLRSIRCFFPSYPEDKGNYYSLKKEYMDQIIVYLQQLSLVRKSLNTPSESKLKELAENHLKQQFDEVQKQILEVEELYQERQKIISSLVLKIRNGDVEQDALNEPLTDSQSGVLLEKATDANNRFNALKEKTQLINDLGEHGIKYWNVKELVGEDDKNLETIEQKLLEKGTHQRIFCFDDKMEQQNSLQGNNLYKQFHNEPTHSSQVECVYADFTYCSCQLLQMKILSAKDIRDQQKSLSISTTSKTTTSASETNHLDPTNSQNINFNNILLLGESGVGKSTFINALVNYLHFKSLTEAHSSQPIVLMPVSFLMTVGDQFEEKIVRFGKEDPNEDHNHPGQSVTQHCRSYVFTIGNQTKIRLIDTPGMGDTRGLDQDDLNMQHILSFINNLSHLNAICILLKPNEARLNVVFRSYFTRLLGFLGENIRNNIIFCFTNTRGTFFAPGNTGPLLKKMLNSHSIKDIPFKKTNTFCFDSESFRYLVARLDGIEFDDYQKEEYKQSWMTSVKESNRLLEYICSELKPYPQTDWQSIEHAQFRITQMIRPMLETLRNILRNSILQQEKPSKSLIQLLPKELSRPSTICIACKGTPECFSDFLVLPDDLHHFSENCDNCKCSRESHIDVDYRLEYGNSSNTNMESNDKITQNLDQLKRIILELAYFFAYTVPHSEPADPIMITLTRMITEENEICSSESTEYFNPKLCNELNQFNETYKQKRNNPMLNGNSINLPNIYELIQDISEIGSISKQIDAIKRFRQEYVRNQEKEIS